MHISLYSKLKLNIWIKYERQLLQMYRNWYYHLYGIYMIKCDVIDDNSNIALMIDAGDIFGDILPILYDFLQ